jgi:hypothetical protein
MKKKILTYPLQMYDEKPSIAVKSQLKGVMFNKQVGSVSGKTLICYFNVNYIHEKISMYFWQLNKYSFGNYIHHAEHSQTRIESKLELNSVLLQI